MGHLHCIKQTKLVTSLALNSENTKPFLNTYSQLSVSKTNCIFEKPFVGINDLQLFILVYG